MNEYIGFEHLTKEKNFWDLYLGIRKINSRNDNLAIYIIFLILIAVININFVLDKDIAKSIHDMTNNIISWSLSVLGFAIAGYSIFATLSDKDLQIAMSKITHEQSGLDFLRLAHFNMLRTIIDLIIISTMAYSIQKIYPSIITNNCTALYFKIFCDSMFIAIMISAKSFAFNVYSSIMTSLRWYAENK